MKNVNLKFTVGETAYFVAEDDLKRRREEPAFYVHLEKVRAIRIFEDGTVHYHFHDIGIMEAHELYKTYSEAVFEIERRKKANV